MFCGVIPSMNFTETATIHLPADTVFDLMAERIEVLVPHLPNVASTFARRRGGSGSLPHDNAAIVASGPDLPPLQALRPEMMQWLDASVWDTSDYSETWKVECWVD